MLAVFLQQIEPMKLGYYSLLLLGISSCTFNSGHNIKQEDKDTGRAINLNRTDETTATADFFPPWDFAHARKAFTTRLTKKLRMDGPAETPPDKTFSLVYYPTDIGKMAAYLGEIPDDGRLHPAIIWISGGFGNDIGGVWGEHPADNDQAATPFRKAGVVMMFPSQRGGNGNPGYDESGFGEIDDILAAADFLAKQKGIDTNRIYLGGHSTGGTKVLLAAECSKRFRAVFSFGPALSMDNYGAEELAYDTKDKRESELRSPMNWLPSISTPVFVFEGKGGNAEMLQALSELSENPRNPYTHYYLIRGKNHFSVLQPVCKLLAAAVVADTTAKVTMDFGEALSALK
ncbi:alpha/beta hydrolase family protein [Chitinophaga qingshengii]|uniref:alpha/beta hydrolase family protein n=1 Tax=Chitinophaga qingshengii TaxID=1569794 RepID=UPI001CB6EF49|nr:prolyl oligopeptidase family serine peptidase [Chitinophaga qingshengii]